MRLLPTIALVLLLAPIAAAAPIDWHEDLRKAHTIAQRENKPLLLHFTTDHCVYCDRLEAGAFKSPEVQTAISNGYVPVKIHAGRQPQLAKMFKVTRFPTDVIVTTSGEALVHQVSPQEPEKYTAMLGGPASKMADQVATANIASATVAPASQYGMGPNDSKVAQTAATGGPASFELPDSPAGMMPPMPSDRVEAKPASSQMAGMSMPPMPSQDSRANNQRPPAAAGRVAAASNPTLALEGYCSVSVIKEAKWVQGSPEFGVVHLGQLYLFTDQQKMETFLANPVPFTPMLNGIDVVRFFEERKIVPGKREFSAVDPDHNRVFLFADEDALTHFENTFERYVDSAIAVMDKAVTQSNPVEKRLKVLSHPSRTRRVNKIYREMARTTFAAIKLRDSATLRGTWALVPSNRHRHCPKNAVKIESRSTS